MKTKIDKQVAAAQRRLKKFIDDKFVDLQLETARAFAEARKRETESKAK